MCGKVPSSLTFEIRQANRFQIILPKSNGYYSASLEEKEVFLPSAAMERIMTLLTSRATVVHE